MISFISFVNQHVGQFYSFRDRDCETLTIKGMKEIHGVELSNIKLADFIACHPYDAQIFACRDASGDFCHVGLFASGHGYLHALGTPQSGGGQVSFHTPLQFKKISKAITTLQNVEYYKCRY